MRERYKKILNIVIIILLVIIAVLIVIEYSLIQYLIDTFTPHKIHEFNFRDVGGLVTKGGVISDYDKHDSAYLLDHLYFELTLQNMFYNSKVVVQPRLTISSDSGVDPENISITNFDLNPKESHQIDQFFNPIDEGTNHVSLQILVVNGTNGIVLSNTTSTTNFKVQSLNTALLEDANQVSSRNFVASLIIGIVTTTALGSAAIISYKHAKELRVSNKLLKEQNETDIKQIDTLQEQNQLYRDQFSLLNRPWISMSNQEPGFATVPFKLIVYLKNYGKTPAVDIETKYLLKDRSITIDELKKEGIKLDIASMTPDEIWSENLEMSNLDYTKMLATDNYHLGLYIEYKYENTKNGTTIIIGQIRSNAKEISYKTKDLK